MWFYIKIRQNQQFAFVVMHDVWRCSLIMHRRYRPPKYYLLTNTTNFAGPHLFTDMAVYATVIELCQ